MAVPDPSGSAEPPVSHISPSRLCERNGRPCKGSQRREEKCIYVLVVPSLIYFNAEFMARMTWKQDLEDWSRYLGFGGSLVI